MCLEKFCGSICELHKNPVNCILHLIAGIILIYALWAHKTGLILTAILVAIVGHIIQALNKKTGKGKKKRR